MTTSMVAVVLVDLVGQEPLPKALALLRFNTGVVQLVPTPLCGGY